VCLGQKGGWKTLVPFKNQGDHVNDVERALFNEWLSAVKSGRGW
jgi:hypothetical protein